MLQNKLPDWTLSDGDILYVPSSQAKYLGYAALKPRAGGQRKSPFTRRINLQCRSLELRLYWPQCKTTGGVSLYRPLHPMAIGSESGFMEEQTPNSGQLASGSAEERAHQRHRRVAWTSLAAFGSKVASVATILVTAPLAIRYLGMERYGMWMTSPPPSPCSPARSRIATA